MPRWSAALAATLLAAACGGNGEPSSAERQACLDDIVVTINAIPIATLEADEATEELLAQLTALLDRCERVIDTITADEQVALLDQLDGERAAIILGPLIEAENSP